MITRVRVPSRWTDGGNRFEDIPLYGVADFVLGQGPCGKVVERLDVEYHGHGVSITQVCTCTEQKVFVYPWHTVTGRVEVTYG